MMIDPNSIFFRGYPPVSSNMVFWKILNDIVLININMLYYEKSLTSHGFFCRACQRVQSNSQDSANPNAIHSSRAEC